MDLLDNLDKDALFVTPIATPMADEKLETQLISLTAKSKHPLSNFSDKKEIGEKRSQGGRKGHQKEHSRVCIRILILAI